MPTLARLSFWVPPEQMDAFEAAYEKKVALILRTHNLLESPERSACQATGVFSRLFEMETPSEVAAKEIGLRNDPAWQEALSRLGAVFGTTQPDGLIRTHFGIYRAPARSGKMVEAGPGFRQGSWQAFGVQDGLPCPTITDMLQDRDGNLWFGTEGAGVSRYDGEQFITFTTEDGLADNDVHSILEDRGGNLWFGTGRWFVTGRWVGTGCGVSRYDGEEFATFTTEDGLAGDQVMSIVEDREGHLWFATEGGASRYDGEKFVPFTAQDGLATDKVRSILEDSRGDLWFGTWGGGVSRYDGEQFVTFTTDDGLGSNAVWSILEDREGHLWFGTWGGGASRYDGKEFVTFTTDDGLARNLVRAILEDREGSVWSGTWGAGVSRYDGKQFVTFTTDDGLGDNAVWSILEDREGDLWFGTWGGVSRYDREHMAVFGTADGLVSNGVMCALQARSGDLWFGTWEGVTRYDGAAFVPFPLERGPVRNAVHSILEDRQGHLWFGTFGGGVSRYDGAPCVTFTTDDGLADNAVHAILEDREGHLWFGTFGGGVSRYDPSASSGRFVTFTTEDGLAHNGVWAILEDKEGYLWFGTQGGGVSRYDPSASSGRFVTFTTADGLAHNDVHAILEDREGHLWFGTWGGGVSRYDGAAFVTFTTADGLAHNQVISILEDREGHLWFGTFGGGVSRYDGVVFQSLCRKDGLAHDAVQQVLQDRDGDFWIATEGGVARYRPHRTPPTVHLTEVIADRRYDPIQDIQIPSSQKLILVGFQGRSLYTSPDGMAYVYRLAGYDTDWKTTYTGRAEYHDLPIGEYTFQVKAVDRDLNHSEPATVRITVEVDPRVKGFAEALTGTPEEFVGESPAVHQVEQRLMEVASTDLTALISGETGTGKGLAARILHRLSRRKVNPFIQVNCGAIPEGLVESELFGHRPGAFTGAMSLKLGKVEVADGGTLFLDEIGDLSMAAQAKMLRFLEDQTFERLGGTETLHMDLRVIAATNRDLGGMVDAGSFRKDLYFRLQQFVIELPPLRERREDIPELARYFTQRMAAHVDKQVTHLCSDALEMLEAYDWPGNVRELEHAVTRAVVVCPGSVIRVEDLALGWGTADGELLEGFVPLEEYERRYIRRVLEYTGWVVRGPRGAAAVLGLNEGTLRSRMKKLGITRL